MDMSSTLIAVAVSQVYIHMLKLIKLYTFHMHSSLFKNNR